MQSGLAAAWAARGPTFVMCTNCAHDTTCGQTKYCRHRDGDDGARAWALENARRGVYAFARHELETSHALHAAAGEALRAASTARVSAVLGGRRVTGLRRWTVTALGQMEFMGTHVDDGRHGDVAFELGLSLDWPLEGGGGELVFSPLNQSLAGARAHLTVSDDLILRPVFNTLVVYDCGKGRPPLPVRVDAVADRKPRLAISGWFEVEGGLPGGGVRDHRPAHARSAEWSLESEPTAALGAGGEPVAVSAILLSALTLALLILACCGSFWRVRSTSPPQGQGGVRGLCCGAFRSVIAMGRAAPRHKD